MADEITDAEIARFAGAVKEAEERDAAGRARGAVVATARFGRGLLARLERVERERDEARQSNARLNRRAQEAEAAAERLRKIEARIAERDARKPLPRIEAAFALAAAEDRIATLEAQRDEYAEQYGVMGAALTVAERKLSAYVGVCAGDKELAGAILPKVRAALRGLEGK